MYKNEFAVDKMTHAEEIMKSIAILVKQEGKNTFRRVDIRDKLGITANKWQSGYTSIFQSMRSDPGCAPGVRDKFKGVFHRVEAGRYGEYALTDYGRKLIKEFDC
jgi:hypothetical protein